MTKQPGSGRERDPLIGKMLGDYRLEALMATGGMARIYRGEDTRLGRPAAIKVLAHDDLDDDDTLAKRFQREARELATLEHPNIITIYQYGELEGLYYLAMKLVKGRDLAQEYKRLKTNNKMMEPERVIHILEQVAAALDYAHMNTVIHRDVKPSNILLTDDDTAILTDFGLVMRSSVMTTIGTAFGTPRYIAPEQATASNKALPQSDLYSLAVVLYELLTGEPPFTGDTPMEIALSHISEPPPPPRSKNPSIPAAAEKEILRALDKEPENRQRTVSEFIAAVKRAYGIKTVYTPPAVATIAKSASQSETLPVKNAVNGRATSKSGGRSRLMIAALLLLVVAGGIIFMLLNNRSVTEGGAPITLIYNDSNFTIHNGGDYTLDVLKLQFVRGIPNAGSDDFVGDRIPNDTLNAGTCFRIYLEGNQSADPPQCSAQDLKRVQLSNPLRFFWRRETEDNNPVTSFEIHYDGAVIARCNTVARGGADECRFNWPVVPPTPNT